jgi:AcrR family transcriptional regulator
VGTVCRHFPTKQALIEAVLEALTDTMLASAASALTDPDAGRALRRFALKIVDVSARHRVLAEQLAAAVDGAIPSGSARQQLRAGIAELLHRAQQAGVVRDDVGPADVALLLAGVVYVTDGLSATQPKLRERAVTVILDGLRPAGATPLSGRAIGFSDLDRITKRKGKR